MREAKREKQKYQIKSVEHKYKKHQGHNHNSNSALNERGEEEKPLSQDHEVIEAKSGNLAE